MMISRSFKLSKEYHPYDAPHMTKWCVDALYASHFEIKSHTGGLMTLCKGAIYVSSTFQRTNTKVSTESELFAVNDIMPQILWKKVL